MHHKSEVFIYFQKFKSGVKKEMGWYVRCLRSDGGKEYFSDEFSAFLQQEGIQREFVCRYTPQQNRVAQQKNQHILVVASVMLKQKAHVEVILGQSSMHTICLCNEPMYDIQRPRDYPKQEILRKEIGSIPCKDIRLNSIHAHSRWEAAKAWPNIGEVHPHGVLAWVERLQMLKPIY